MTIEPHESSVVIPISDVYREVRDMHLEIKDMRAELRPIADHESRLRAVERKIWLAAGIAAASTGGLVQALNTFTGG